MTEVTLPTLSVSQAALIPVSRIQATAHNTNAELTLDIAPELYALAAGETFTLALAKNLVQDDLELNGDGTGAGAGEEDAPKKVKRELWRSDDQGLAADYEYVMYGKVGISLCCPIRADPLLLGQGMAGS